MKLSTQLRLVNAVFERRPAVDEDVGHPLAVLLAESLVGVDINLLDSHRAVDRRGDRFDGGFGLFAEMAVLARINLHVDRTAHWLGFVASHGKRYDLPATACGMSTILLVRHGETEWNRERRVQGWAPVALTDDGHSQAASLAARLAEKYSVDRLVSSDLRRTLETARPIARAVGCELTTDRRWRERNFGVLQGLGYGELFLGHPEFTLSEVGYRAAEATPEGGESLIDQRERVLDAFGDLRASLAADETAVVVTHGGPLYLVVGWLRGLDIEATILDHEQGNCALNEIVDDGTLHIARENDCSHLD